MKSYKLFALSCALSALCAASASASLITYYDASGSNTVSVTSGLALSDSTVSTTASAVDNLWRARTDTYTNAATVFQADGNENCQRLATTVTGLTDGTYEVFAYYWAKNTAGTSPTEHWMLRAGLTNSTSDLALYASTANSTGTNYVAPDGTSTAAVAADFSNLTPGSSGALVLMQASLGTAVVSGGSVTVYVDDYVGTVGVNQRTWFDGVGVRAVPEPSTIALLCLGGLALAFRARRK